MTNLEKLLSIASEPLAGQPATMPELLRPYLLGGELFRMLQAKNGMLARGKRLMPKTPFFLGGEYHIDNLYEGNSLEGMRLKAELAMQTRHLPEGARVELIVRPRPKR